MFNAIEKECVITLDYEGANILHGPGGFHIEEPDNYVEATRASRHEKLLRCRQQV